MSDPDLRRERLHSEMAGDEAIKSVVQQSGIQVGLVFNEREAGTNSINLVLEHRQPFQLVGDEHYYEFLGSSACYSVPFNIRTSQFAWDDYDHDDDRPT